jgi:hypothetical protein
MNQKKKKILEVLNHFLNKKNENKTYQAILKMPTFFLEFKQQITGSGYLIVFSITIFRIPVLGDKRKKNIQYRTRNFQFPRKKQKKEKIILLFIILQD